MKRSTALLTLSREHHAALKVAQALLRADAATGPLRLVAVGHSPRTTCRRAASGSIEAGHRIRRDHDDHSVCLMEDGVGDAAEHPAHTSEAARTDHDLVGVSGIGRRHDGARRRPFEERRLEFDVVAVFGFERLQKLPAVRLVDVERLLVVRVSEPVRDWLYSVHRHDPAAFARPVSRVRQSRAGRLGPVVADDDDAVPAGATFAGVVGCRRGHDDDWVVRVL